MIWNRDVDMIVDTSEVEEIPWGGERAQWCNLHRMRWSLSRRRVITFPHWKARRNHQNQEWGTSMYRSVNDARAAAMSPLERYEWMAIEKATCHEYNEKTHVQEWGCLMQADLLGPMSNPRGGGGIENKIRGRLLAFSETTKGKPGDQSDSEEVGG